MPYPWDAEETITSLVAKQLILEQFPDIEVKKIRILGSGWDNTAFLVNKDMSCIVHGDFYVRHLLVDEKKELTRVIDWGDLHIGDPAIDLAIAHSFLPIRAHDVFRQCYGDIQEETWVLARLRAVFLSTNLILFGYHVKDQALVFEGKRALDVIASLG